MADDLGFIDPTACGNKPKIEMALRPSDLAGKVVGLLNNTKEQGELILTTIGDALRARYGVAGIILRTKETFSKPAPVDMINEMADKVQVAVTALGG